MIPKITDEQLRLGALSAFVIGSVLTLIGFLSGVAAIGLPGLSLLGFGAVVLVLDRLWPQDDQ